MKTDKQIALAAVEFAERWQGKGYEKGESQLFWADLLTTVFGVENLPSFIRYEEQVHSMVATAQGTYICTMVHNGCPTFLNQTTMGLAEITESITTIKYIENDKKNYSY
ncbi:MAG: hypothetical protein ILA44_02285 [Prevotella sp.]|nr:hypothetical protein [Prevotella sp.]